MPHDLPLPTLTGQIPYDVEIAIDRLRDYSVELDSAQERADTRLATLESTVAATQAALDALQGPASSLISILQTTEIAADQIILEDFTPGSVLFVGAANQLAEDNDNLFWNDTLNQLGIGTTVFPSTGSEVLVFGDGTAPSSMGLNTAGLYANNVAGTVKLFGITEADVTGELAMNAAALTAGSIPFADANGLLAQDNSNLFWDNTTKRLGIGINAPLREIHLKQTTQAFMRIEANNNTAGLEFISGAIVQQVFQLDVAQNLVFRNTTGTHNGSIFFDYESRVFFRAGASTTTLYITQNGIIAIGSVVGPLTGTFGLIFADGTALSSMESNTAGLYADDVSGTVNLFSINEADRLTRLTGPFSPLGSNLEESQVDFASTELTGLSGATVTATNLIPAGSFITGVTIRVTTTITGATTFDIGDGTDVDRWGAAILLPAGTTTSIADFTADGFGQFVAANNVVLTANGANFTAGAVRVTVHYVNLVAATS